MTNKLNTAALAAALSLITGACTGLPPNLSASHDAPSAGVNAGMMKPLMDRRDAIIATGYAVIGVQNNKNAPQQRILAIRAAKIDAYRGLAEACMHCKSTIWRCKFSPACWWA